MEHTSTPGDRRSDVRLGKNSDVTYKKSDVIGRGQFGTVYRGVVPATGTVVAIKLLQNVRSVATSTSEHSGQLSGEGGGGGGGDGDRAAASSSATAPPARSRPPGFPLELEILCDVRADNCPNIVRVLSMWSRTLKTSRAGADSAATTTAAVRTTMAPPSASSSAPSHDGEPSRIFVMVTEYCEGGDLQRVMQARASPLPTHVARSFTYQLCNALFVLRRRRIVHRDIKPANLLLTSADLETATLKVADFGMAKAAPAPRSRRTDPASTAGDGKAEAAEANSNPSPLFYSEMGTPMYMSPERLALQPYGYKADVYSAGMVLLEMMRGSCVQVKWESQLRTEVPLTIWRELRQYAPDRVPPWLDLVQRMTAADPAQRCSVEDALRHAWFLPDAGPPLPPLTFALPEKPHGDGGERSAGAAAAAAVHHHVDPEPLASGAAATTAAATATATAAAAEAAAVAPSSSSSCVVGAGAAAARPSPPPQQQQQHGETRSAGDSGWAVLGVCAGVDPALNIAHGTLIGAPKPAAATAELANPSASAVLALPPGCGPHIITNAVRAFVDVAYLYVLQDELEAVPGLTLVAYLKELLQNGYAAFLTCLESLGCCWRQTSPMRNCAFGGHRLVVRDVEPLYAVWRQLTARVQSAQAAYTARLPARAHKSAAAWLLRLGPTATLHGSAEDEDEPAAAVEEGDVVDISLTPSEPDVRPLVPGRDVAGLECVDGGADIGGASPAVDRLRASSVCVRAEQLIFSKALECIESETLSMLLATAATPSRIAGSGDLDTMDCVEEEEAEEESRTAAAAMRANQLRSTPSPAPSPSPSPPPPPSPPASPCGDRLPPHRGVALLRVLLRRAVLSLAEAGLRVKGPLPTTTTTSPSMSADAVAQHVVVVQVPIFGTLSRADLQVVETLLHAATRVFSSSCSGGSTVAASPIT
ncbi:Protein kinase domain/Protein tyrosine kinase [Novymonas esmeraldas]|uniref:Protein kinase domain/Protein tyrosine kinase n=1 Tax=Novymonas esmeraldas TaxID=1808958 RepID=A0AAW0F2N6_9TRYP